jgi:hypothetical protein
MLLIICRTARSVRDRHRIGRAVIAIDLDQNRYDDHSRVKMRKWTRAVFSVVRLIAGSGYPEQPHECAHRLDHTRRLLVTGS